MGTHTQVSTTCEVLTGMHLSGPRCGKPAVGGYPAMGGGYMMLCEEHIVPHRPYCVTVEEAERGVKPVWSATPLRREPEETSDG